MYLFSSNEPEVVESPLSSPPGSLLDQDSSHPSITEETRSGSRSHQNSTSEKGSLNELCELPTNNFPEDISTEEPHANIGDSPERGHSMDPYMQNVMSLPSNGEERQPEAVSVKTVSSFHCRISFLPWLYHSDQSGCSKGG